MLLLFFFSKVIYTSISRENAKLSLGFSYNQKNVKLLFQLEFFRKTLALNQSPLILQETIPVW